MDIRRYKPEDLEEIGQLFYDTILSVNGRDYTEEQVKAWAARRESLVKDARRFLDSYTLVAVEGERIVGYGNMEEGGHLDCLYVHKDFQRQGVAAALCDRLESYAFDRGAGKITVDASVTALPFFLHRGYKIIREQHPIRAGVKLLNYHMEKARG
ncbi:MAG TPA: GNAT family N-acetyltransferase [Firmicutes bacterium]|nr:GNAT family N-acetyltransferase [Bacillota bacterium]